MGTSTATSFLLLLLLLLLLTSFPALESLSFSQYHSLISLSQSLTSRVANLRASRGDHAGAARARQISTAIEGGLGLGFINFMASIGYDYLKNYAWRTGASEMVELKELISSLTELIQMNSVQQRTAWVTRNHQKLIRLSRGLLKIFRRSGPLKEVLEALHKEVVDGDLLKDCLHLGNNDFIAVLQLLKEIATQYYQPSSSSSTTTDL